MLLILFPIHKTVYDIILSFLLFLSTGGILCTLPNYIWHSILLFYSRLCNCFWSLILQVQGANRPFAEASTAISLVGLSSSANPTWTRELMFKFFFTAVTIGEKKKKNKLDCKSLDCSFFSWEIASWNCSSTICSSEVWWGSSLSLV